MKRILGLSAVILLVAVGVWGYFYVQSRARVRAIVWPTSSAGR